MPSVMEAKCEKKNVLVLMIIFNFFLLFVDAVDVVVFVIVVVIAFYYKLAHCNGEVHFENKGMPFS